MIWKELEFYITQNLFSTFSVNERYSKHQSFNLKKTKKTIQKKLELRTNKNTFFARCQSINKFKTRLAVNSTKNSNRSKQKSLRSISIRHSTFNFNQSNRWFVAAIQVKFDIIAWKNCFKIIYQAVKTSREYVFFNKKRISFSIQIETFFLLLSSQYWTLRQRHWI